MKDILPSDIKDTIDKPSNQNIESFNNFKNAKIKLIEPGDKLWRFSTDNEKFFSDCWVDTTEMEQVFYSFVQQKAQNNFGTSDTQALLKDNFRNLLAVLANWETNPNFIVEIEFKKNVIAYHGGIGSQQFFAPIIENAKANIGPVYMTHANLMIYNKAKTFDPRVRPEDVKVLIERRIGGLNQYVIPRFKYNIIQNNADANFDFVKYNVSKLKESSWYKRFTW